MTSPPPRPTPRPMPPAPHSPAVGIALPWLKTHHQTRGHSDPHYFNGVCVCACPSCSATYGREGVLCVCAGCPDTTTHPGAVCGAKTKGTPQK